jgi:hypothetical protein
MRGRHYRIVAYIHCGIQCAFVILGGVVYKQLFKPL